MATITGTAASETLIGTTGADIIYGLDGNDELRGGSGNDTLIGGAGADFLRGETGTDTVSYASSSAAVQVDVTSGINAGTGGDAEGDTYGSNEIYIGSIYNDTFTGGASVTFNGGLGDDTYFVNGTTVGVVETSGEGNDTVYASVNYTLSNNVETLIYNGTGNFGGIGNDQDNTIVGGDNWDRLIGEGGADHLVGGGGADFAEYSTSTSGLTVNLQTQVGTGDALGDTYDSIENVIGSAGNDHITGDAGNNELQGGTGNDTLIGGAGADFLRGQTGVDTVVYAGSTAAIQVDVTSGVNTGTGGDAEGDTYGENEIYIGSIYSDTFTGGANVTFNGGLGNDTYVVNGTTVGVVEISGEGTDTVNTSLTNYTLSANVENLTYTGTSNSVGTGNAENNIIITQGGADRLFGLDGNDILFGGASGDTITGGNGLDTSSYSNSNSGVNVNLLTSAASGGYATGDVLSGIENLTGSAFNDVLTGDNAANTLLGGAGDDSISGNDGDDFIEGGAGGDTISGGNGFDTLTYASSTHGVAVDLQTGVNIGGDSVGDVISGIEKIIGTAFSDTFVAISAMTLEGGAGDDFYVFDVSGVAAIEMANAGLDQLSTALSNYTLNANIENLVYRGSASAAFTGNALDNSVFGGANNDVLSGADGNDVLLGKAGADTLMGGLGLDAASYVTAVAGVAVDLSTSSGTAGDAAGDVLSSIEMIIGSNFADTLTAASTSTLAGGAGNDIYVINGSGVVVTEISGNGTDIVQTSLLNYTLDAFVENLTYTGAGNATLTGTSAANVITGGSGDDVLIGGLGGDTLAGGAGTDTANYATSTAGISVNLTTLAASGGDAAGDVLSSIEAVVGTAFTDTLTASSAATFVGGAGNDIYIVNGSGIILTEQSGGGTDIVQTSLNVYTLDANIENLTFTGSGNATLTGNSLANIITGGVGADILTGAAGDTLVGGAGNDTYVVTGSGVVVTETSNNGTDTVQSSLNTYTLGSNIENLTFIETGNATLTGNSLANIITGGNGDDVLLGGAGGDTLVGGMGIDTASYATSSASVSVDLTTLTLSGGDATGDVLSGIENVIGSAFADTFTASSAATLTGGAGNDLYIVNGTSVVLTEQAAGGTDTVNTTLNVYILAANIESLTFTGAGDATLTGNSLANIITGGTGNDMLTAAAGDTLIGNAGDDLYVVTGTGAVVIESADNGNDSVETSLNTYALAANIENLTFTGSGNATLTGNELANILTGGAGDDVLIGAAGGDTLVGGSGTDSATYANAAAAIVVDLLTGAHAGDAAGDVYSSIESFIGSSFDDTFTGDGNANAFFGGNGADLFIGSGGADVLNGSSGLDTVDYSSSAGGIAVDLTTGTGVGGDADGNTLISIEKIIASAFDDTLTTNSAATLVGGAGDDTYVVNGAGVVIAEASGEGVDGVLTSLTSLTLAGNVENLAYSGTGDFVGTGNGLDNIISGGTGDDVLIGGAGSDTLDGGNGHDTADYTSSASAVTVDLSTGAGTGGDADGDILISIEQVIGSTSGDTFTAVSDATFIGGAGDDTYIVNGAGVTLVENSGDGTDTVETSLTSYALENHIESLIFTGSGNASLTGNGADNTIVGAFGNDTITGAGGGDTLAGNDGDDILTGGNGADTLSGGAGADTLLFASTSQSNAADGVDLISDFSQTDGDQIDLSAIGGLTFVGTDAFSGVAGELRYENVGGDTLVFADLNGDTTADLEIHLTGTIALTSTDFLV